MGSVFYITVYAADAAQAEKAALDAFRRVDEINAIASDYLPESELSRFNRAAANEPVKISSDLFQLFEESIRAARLTDGAFDITATYAIQQWRRAKRKQKLPTPEETQKAVAMTDWRQLSLDDSKHTAVKRKEGVLLDLGGIGKGYAADAALRVLNDHGITRAVVAASGDLAIGDSPPGKEGWDVALRTFEKPEESDRLTHVILNNCGCSTSGDLHQFLELEGKRYSHIVNPRTGLGLTERIGCTLIAPTATTADSLATAFCVMGVERTVRLVESTPGLMKVHLTWLEQGEMKARDAESKVVEKK
ncbi:MAG: FAD:protein FMN transferase [Verrucomicrobium sp.]